MYRRSGQSARSSSHVMCQGSGRLADIRSVREAASFAGVGDADQYRRQEGLAPVEEYRGRLHKTAGDGIMEVPSHGRLGITNAMGWLPCWRSVTANMMPDAVFA